MDPEDETIWNDLFLCSFAYKPHSLNWLVLCVSMDFCLGIFQSDTNFIMIIQDWFEF